MLIAIATLILVLLIVLAILNSYGEVAVEKVEIDK
jgi:hypothetical protein